MRFCCCNCWLQAYREEGPKQPLYRVRFQQTDVWELYPGKHPTYQRICCGMLRCLAASLPSCHCVQHVAAQQA